MKTPFKKKKTERTGFQWVNTWRFNLHGDSGTVVQTETRLVSPEPKFLNINFTASKSLASLDHVSCEAVPRLLYVLDLKKLSKSSP